MKNNLAVAYAMKRKSKKMADGGQVQQPKDDVPEPNKKSAEDFQKGLNAPGTDLSKMATNIKEGLGMAEGGRAGKQRTDMEKGVHQPYGDADLGKSKTPKERMGQSMAGDVARDKHQWASQEHRRVLHELQDMKKPNLLADGGFIEEEMADGHEDHIDNAHDADDMMEDELIHRIMQHRANRYSRGGMIANESGIGKLNQMADSKPNMFDDLVLRDDLESSYTGANSGDEIGNEQEDHDRSDIIAKIMASRRKKDRMPRPA